MYEYSIAEEFHIEITKNPARLFPLAMGLLGDFSSEINSESESGDDQKKDLLFSARFFDAYMQARQPGDLDSKLLLLTAASYYLSDLPGDALVFGKRLGKINFKGIEGVLSWALQGYLDSAPNIGSGPYRSETLGIFASARTFFRRGAEADTFRESLKIFRTKVYDIGSSEELLFGDIACAVIEKRIENSVWTQLPQSSNLPVETWRRTILKDGFLREFWPSQKLLSEAKVFQGTSAVIQMPTGAGKTRSVEIAIRSAILRDQTLVCAIVAPFKALCHEIRHDLRKAFRGEEVDITELTDVYQDDFDSDEILQQQHSQIIVVTPEKLVYLLRQNSDFASKIGLLILDEGHQFDTGIRGVTYELLVTTLRTLIPESSQKILISAVISNADAINNWLNGEEGVVARGQTLPSTFKTIGFTSWQTQRGAVHYVDPENVNETEFFVPRVIESRELARRGRERVTRVFPDRSSKSSVALFLTLKLVKNGPVALFCGMKSSVLTLCTDLVDKFARNVDLPKPSTVSNPEELERLTYLYKLHLGDDSIEAAAANLGVLSHHASVPRGIRQAVEHAIREGLAKVVVCTSTLAQGVNLPIRYLIFTNIYQAGERLKVRDFHNLIGRAGRSGMQTEGTILFADPDVYDNRRSNANNWAWKQTKHLLDSGNSEPCASSLLKVLDPIINRDEVELTEKSTELLIPYIEGSTTPDQIIQRIVQGLATQGFDESTVRYQVEDKIKAVAAIESFLISTVDGESEEAREEMAVRLAENTFAHSLATDPQKEDLAQLFATIAKNIEVNAPANEETKKVFGKTLLGIREINEILAWLNQNSASIVDVMDDQSSLFEVLWPIALRSIKGSNLKKCVPEEAQLALANGWLAGYAFHEILRDLKETHDAKMRAGTTRRSLTVQHVVEMCEGGLAFEAMLIVGAIAEMFENNLVQNDSDIEWSQTTLPETLRYLQKMLKYGLVDQCAIVLFELGFTDRVICQELSQLLSLNLPSRLAVIAALKDKFEEAILILLNYPDYFQAVLEEYAPEDEV